jgi:Putative zinc-finger
VSPPASTHPTSFELDAVALGIADADERARVERHLAECDACRSISERAARDRAHFTDQVFDRTLPALQRRVAAATVWPIGRARGLFYVLPAAAGIALVSFLALRGGDDRNLHPAIAIKGDPSFQPYVQRAGRVVPVTSGANIVGPGDGIRFVVRPSGFSHLLVVSVDGAGHANVYFPYGEPRSGSIQEDGEITLPGSIVFDRTPGPERIFALFSKSPLEAETALAALRRVGAGGASAIRSATRLEIPGAQAESTVLVENTGTPVAP